MVKKSDNIFLDLIEEMDLFKKNSENLTSTDIEVWKGKVLGNLSNLQKLRFKKLELYEELKKDYINGDEIPF